MKIKKEDLKTFWYEDSKGKKLPYDIEVSKAPKEAAYLVSCFPLKIHERRFRVALDEDMEKESDCSAREVSTRTMYLGSQAERTIIAMVNSGKYTLSEAMLVYSRCCERCMNVLAYTYTNKEIGYEEYGKEWQKSATSCEFCCADEIL